MQIALDTNVIAYAEGANGFEHSKPTTVLLRRLPRGSLVLPAQVLGELFNVLVRKAKFPPVDAHAVVSRWRHSLPLALTTIEAMDAALDLARDHGLSIWDAVIVSASESAGCGLLLSEDMHDGFVWRGVTVANPYADNPHPLLARILEGSS